MIKRNLLISLSILFFINLNAQWDISIQHVELIPGEAIGGQPLKEYKGQPDTEKQQKMITLYPDIRFQTLEGIGGAFNEIGGEALMSLPEKERREVMKNLFDPEEGAGFTLCRTAVGSSDFGIDAYSYSERAGDYLMKHFSIVRDQKYVLPYIKTGLEFNPRLQVFASPWSPPGWMKESGLMDRGVEMPEKNHLIDKPEIYMAYALYFSKYIQAYGKEGVPISRLIIQNEPDVHTKYPSCLMTPEQMAGFAKDYLVPRFHNDGLKTEIWAGTFRTAQQLDALEFAANPEMRSTVDGIGFQYTRPQYIHEMLELFPEARFMHTEGACHNGENSIEQGFRRLEEVAGYINAGCPNYCYWNMILNETGKSGWDWKQNSLINIDRSTGKITFNPDFAAITLFSRYLKPGTERIASFCRESLISVRDGKDLILILGNMEKEALFYECRIDDEKVHFSLPPESLCAIKLKKL